MAELLTIRLVFVREMARRRSGAVGAMLRRALRCENIKQAKRREIPSSFNPVPRVSLRL